MSNLDHEPIATTIKAAIAAEMVGAPYSVGVYDRDEIPGTSGNTGTLPEFYVTIGIQRDPGGSRRASGEVVIPIAALTTTYYAPNIATVRELARRTGIALEDRAYDLPAPSTDHVGPFVHALGEEADEIDTGWSAVDHWTFA